MLLLLWGLLLLRLGDRMKKLILETPAGFVSFDWSTHRNYLVVREDDEVGSAELSLDELKQLRDALDEAIRRLE